MEVAPGIHRIESVLGPRPFSQYLLRDERTVLVDTGVKETPGDVILPFLGRFRYRPRRDRRDRQHARRRRPLRRQRGDARGRAAGARLRARARRRLDREPGADPSRALRLVRGARHRLPARRRQAGSATRWARTSPSTSVFRAARSIRLGPRLEAHVLHLPGPLRAATSACGCRALETAIVRTPSWRRGSSTPRARLSTRRRTSTPRRTKRRRGC